MQSDFSSALSGASAGGTNPRLHRSAASFNSTTFSNFSVKVFYSLNVRRYDLGMSSKLKKTVSLFAVITFPLVSMATPVASRMLDNKPLSKEQLSGQCLKLDLGESKLDCTTCKVVDVQHLADVGDQKLTIARYEYFWAKDSGLKECGYGTVVTKEANGSVKYEPIWGGFGSAKSSDNIKIFKQNGISFVSVPVRYSGTAAFRSDGLLSFKDGRWHEIDTQAYQAELNKRIPSDLKIQKGLYPDFDHMTVESGLWKKNDTNCCPSGGQFTAKLSVDNDKLVVTDFKQTTTK